MSLPAHLLRELLTFLKTDGAQYRATDKRRAPRVGLRKPIHILPVTPPHSAGPLPCWIRNLSGTGVGLLARRPLPVGTQFILPYSRPDGHPLRILYRTTHLAPAGYDTYSIGARLLRMVDPLDVPRAADVDPPRANRRAAS